MKVIAIIPARSGSKGLKNKNIKLLKGKPLISYTIEAAIKSNVFDEIVVSTDSKKYSVIAKKYGAKVPFLRSKKNSSDRAKSFDVVLEVINNYKKFGNEFDAFCILQSTSPLRDYKDIKKAFNLFENKSKVAVVSVTESEHPLSYYNTLDKTHSLDGFLSKKNLYSRRQDSEKYYRINGAIYFAYINEFLKDQNLYRKGSLAYIMSKAHSIDIDDEIDFMFAESLCR